MAEVTELLGEELSFLLPYLPPYESSGNSHHQHNDLNPGSRGPILASTTASTRPFVTLTYACSLDSMISLAPGTRTTLSGPETKSMTHYLRLKHDAILVGVSTAVADDPGLNCRYPGITLELQPQPVVLDPSARWDIANSKAKMLADNGSGKPPWTIHSATVLPIDVHAPYSDHKLYVDGNGLMPHGAVGQERCASPVTRLDWQIILAALTQKGINSVMIEGGATIINDLLSQPDLVDAVIITIAPTFLGRGGVTVSPSARTESGQRINAANLENTSWRQFGQDVVLCARLTK